MGFLKKLHFKNNCAKDSENCHMNFKLEILAWSYGANISCSFFAVIVSSE